MPWISKNDYLTRSEMQNNATIFYQTMTEKGWSIHAISAMLGNIESESSVNPGIWEGLSPFDTDLGGYGLVQWTPWTKYSEWATSHGYPSWQGNGDAECARIEYEAQNGLQWFDNPEVTPSSPPISFLSFKSSNLPIATLANYFLWYYEHPADVNQPWRATQAISWYDYLQGITPTPTPKKKSKLIYYQPSIKNWILFRR